MIIAIASGKGGTGKTTVASALAKTMGNRACLLDCDVEEPNSHIFLKGKTTNTKIITTPIPIINAEACTNCGKCVEFCEYNALASTENGPILFPEMCHSCGGCIRICPEKAISEQERRIGEIEECQTDTLTYFTGRVDIGTPLVPPIIEALKKINYGDKHIILDAPPGTSCPVIATLKGVDYVIMVTEPTPFGLHDLKLAIDIVRKMQLPFGVIINRVTEKKTPTHQLCAKENIDILAEIPHDRCIAQSYAKGEIFFETLPKYKSLFKDLAEKVFCQ